ncbi:hypothetical protein RRG08_060972 [Elysia crispata]|uniref:Uncharacterized protein n=1 Tax=Elysia crispata TaxID=231223 RepID=A0AAE1AUS8_9GAST|nr:hypothetical protein RRG08_060972 [Elysia crispata]
MDIIIDIHSIVSGITSSRAKPPPRTCSDTPATVNHELPQNRCLNTYPVMYFKEAVILHRDRSADRAEEGWPG